MFFFQEFHSGIIQCSTAEHWFADSASLQSWFGTRLQSSLALHTTLMASSGNFRLGTERNFTLFFVKVDICCEPVGEHLRFSYLELEKS